MPFRAPFKLKKQIFLTFFSLFSFSILFAKKFKTIVAHYGISRIDKNVKTF